MIRKLNINYTNLLIILLSLTCTLQLFSKVSYKIYKRNTSSLILSPSSDRYTCYYSSLWCGCFSQTYGCHTACAPMHIITISNVTECPHRESYFLSGFKKY